MEFEDLPPPPGGFHRPPNSSFEDLPPPPGGFHRPPPQKEPGFLSQAGSVAPLIAADILGIPGDLSANVTNLGKAAFGSVAVAAGRPDLAPDITPNEQLPMTSDWLKKRGEDVGLIDPEPTSKAGKFLRGGAELVGGLAVPFGGPSAKISEGERLVRSLTPSAVTVVDKIGQFSRDVSGKTVSDAKSKIVTPSPAMLPNAERGVNEQLAKSLQASGFDINRALVKSPLKSKHDITAITGEEIQPPQAQGEALSARFKAHEAAAEKNLKETGDKLFSESNAIGEAKDKEVADEAAQTVKNVDPDTGAFTYSKATAETKSVLQEPALKKYLSNLDADIPTRSADIGVQLKSLRDEIASTRGYRAATELARKYGNLGFGRGELTGYGALPKRAYQEAYINLTTALGDYVKESKVARSTYTEMLEEMNQYRSKIGDLLGKEDVAGYEKTAPESIGGKVFGQGSSADMAIDLFGKSAASHHAAHYYASELKKLEGGGVLTAKQVEDFIEKHSAAKGGALDKFPDIKSRIKKKALDPIQEFEHERGKADTSAKMAEAHEIELRKAQKEITEKFNQFSTAAPEKQTIIFEREILPKLESLDAPPELINEAKQIIKTLNDNMAKAKSAEEYLQAAEKKQSQSRELAMRLLKHVGLPMAGAGLGYEILKH